MSPTRRPSRRAGHRPTRPARSSPRVGPLVGGGPAADAFDVDALLDDRGTEIVVCCGSGGVGKTTTAAALALRAAERGRSVVVLTIDPARRLAQSLGLSELDNTPAPVDAGPAVAAAGGRLDAMMLDMKRTFDEVVEAHASPEKARQILANPFYVALSSSFAGTQEYMAMEKLGQLHARGPRGPRLGPDRRRHPAVTIGTGLPGRARAAVLAAGRPLHQAARRTRPRACAAALGRAGRRDRHAHQGAGRTGAARRADVRGGVRHPVRRVPAARREYVRPAAGAAHGIHRGGHARARRPARGGLLRGAAERGPDATGRAWC